MKIANIRRMTITISAFIAVACMALLPVGQAFALTNVSDWAYEANGEPLSWCSDSAGTTINFGLNCNTAWQAQYELTDPASGYKYYYWHPYGDTSLCLTASTTQKGILKLESCVGAYQQLWYNPNSGGYYHLYNGYYLEYLYEAGGTLGTGTNFTTDGTYGDNGQTFYQT